MVEYKLPKRDKIKHIEGFLSSKIVGRTHHSMINHPVEEDDLSDESEEKEFSIRSI